MARTLMAVRTLGRGRGERDATPVGRRWATPTQRSCSSAESPHEIVLGFVGRPWPGGDPVEAPATREAFVAYQPDDDVKVAMSLRVAPTDYGTLLLTETRILVGPLGAAHVRPLLADDPRRLGARAPLAAAGHRTARRGADG